MGDEPRLYRELLRRRPVETWGNFSWLSLRTLLQSANDVVVKHLDTSIVNQRRMRWVAEQRARGIDVERPVRLPDVRRMVLLGDPGEMDASQYVLVRDLAQTDADALLMMSDIVYPAGNVNAWRDAVYLPYLGEPRKLWDDALRAAGAEGLTLPDWRVFATPGNHDWYDGLTGFMFHACGAEPLPRDAFSAEGLNPSQRLAKRLWRKPSRPDRAALEPLRRSAAARCGPGDAPDAMPRQPGPYFALDVGGEDGGEPALRLVCVDNGIDGSIDAEQALWLEKVLPGEIPKVLVLGKPTVVGNTVEHFAVDLHEKDVERTLTNIVQEHAERLVASVAGDIHNAQRVILAGEPTEEPDGLHLDADEPARHAVRSWGLSPVHLVAGGGGAFLSATHGVPLTADGGLDLPGLPTVPADRHLRFPSREASVLHYSRRLGRTAAWVVTAHGILLTAALLALALVADGSADRVKVAEADAPTWQVVAGGFSAAAILVLVAISAFVLRSGAAVPRRAKPVSLVLLAVALGCFALSWRSSPAETALLGGAVLMVLGLPVALISAPLLRAYPELRRRVPVRTAAAVLLFLVTGWTGVIDGLDLRLIVLLAVGIVLVVVAGGIVVGRTKEALNRAAIDNRLRPARTAAHVVAFWPLAAAAALILCLPDALDAHAGVQDAAALIALIELAAVAVFVSYKLLGTVRTAWATLPRRSLVAALAVAAVGVVVTAALPLDAGLGWDIAFALPAGTLAAGLMLFTPTRAHPDQVALALQARDGHDPPGLKRSGALFRAMAIAAVPGISELSEATEPPFHKNFLIVDVDDPGRIVLELRGCDEEGEGFLVDRLTLNV